MKNSLKIIIGIYVCLFLSFPAFSQDSIVIEMDQLLSACWSAPGVLAEDQGNEVMSLRSWFDSLPEAQKQTLLDVLLDRVEKASEKDENVAFIKASEEYLLLCPSDAPLRGDILEFLGKVYADQRDAMKLSSTYDRLVSYSALTGQDYSATLASLKKSVEDNMTVSQDLVGLWVSEETDNSGFPKFAINIEKEGVAALDFGSGFKRGWHFAGENIYVQRYEVNENTGEFLMNFYSQHVKKGNQFLAGAMYNMSQATGQAHAEYSAQRGVSFSDAAGAALEASVIAALFDLFGEEISKSRSRAYVVTFQGRRERPGVLNANINQLRIKATTDDTIEEEHRTSTRMFKIDPEKDHIVFTGSQRQYVTEEDAKLLKKCDNKGWYFVVPMIVGAGAGVGICVKGLVDYAKAQDDIMKKKATNTLLIAGGVTLGSILVFGGLGIAFSGQFQKEFHVRQMNKVKAKYGVDVSAVPVYDPFTNTAGGSIAFTF